MDPRTNGLVRVGLALAVVLTLMLIIRRLFAKSGHLFAGASRPSGVVEVLARYPVGRGQTMMLVKLGRRVLLVHQTNGSMQTLTEIDDQREVAHLLARLEAGASGRAGERFKRMLKVYDTAYADMPNADSDTPETGEVIDLTRRPRLRLLGGERAGRKSA